MALCIAVPNCDEKAHKRHVAARWQGPTRFQTREKRQRALLCVLFPVFHPTFPTIETCRVLLWYLPIASGILFHNCFRSVAWERERTRGVLLLIRNRATDN